jgi:hypothetical protein
MTKVADIKADKRFPSFITGHHIFSSGLEIKKVFPAIGLENFTQKVNIDNSSEVLSAAEEVITFISTEVNSRISSLTRYAEIKTAPTADSKAFGPARKVKYKKCSCILKKFKTLLSKSYKSFIVLNEKTNKITLNLSDDIMDDEKKLVFKRGEGLFKVYQKINELLREAHFLPLGSLDQAPAFKKYNSVNIPGSESKIVFSSSGIEGAWDLATMSMRGISSCQTWGQGNSTHLVGSIVDPFTAIMYLTTGSDFDGKGSKMMRRCIVRFLIDESNKPSLVLERMYPAHNKDVEQQFLNILKEKTGGKFPIANCSLIFRNGVSKAYIPLTPIMAKLEHNAHPYRDSDIQFKQLISNRASYLESVRNTLSFIPAHYSAKARVASGKIKKSELSDAVDRATWAANKGIDSPIYSVVAEITFVLRQAIDEAIVNIKDTNVKVPVVALQVFDSVFAENVPELFAQKVTDLYAKRSKKGISSTYKGLLKQKIKEAFIKEIEKDRAKLVGKVEKIKGSTSLPLPDDSVIELIQKVS